MAGPLSRGLNLLVAVSAAVLLATEAGDAESLAEYHEELYGNDMDDLSREAGSDPRALTDDDDDEEENETSAAAPEIRPPVVEFIGRAPKLRVYPGGNSGGNDTWVMLSFGAINEVDAGGKKVNGRAIMSLASASMEWGQENETLGGARALVTTMTLNMEWGGPFKQQCPGAPGGPGGGGGSGGGSGGGGLPGADDDAGADSPGSAGSESPGSVAVKIFVFEDAAAIDYGNYSIDVHRGQMKFNVESGGWPFCGEDHALEVNMDIKSGGSGSPSMKEKPEGPKSGKGGGMGRGPKAKQFFADAGGRGVNMDLPTVAILDDEPQDIDVELDARGGKTNILWRFPYFSDSLVYDPNVGFEGLVDDGSETTDSGSDAVTDQNDDSDDTAADGTTVGAEETDSEEGSTTAAAEEAKVVVSGTASLTVPDAQVFCDNEEALAAIAAVLSDQTSTSADEVSLGCEVGGGRRLSAEDRSRRLQETAVIAYEIAIEAESSAGSISAESPAVVAVQDAITNLDADSLTALVRTALEDAGVDIEVTVAELSQVAVDVVLPGTTASTTAGAPTQTDAAPRSGVADGVLAALFAAAVGLDIARI